MADQPEAVHIYAMDDTVEYVAARSIEEARLFYIEQIGVTPDGNEYQVSDAQLDQLKFLDEEGDWGDQMIYTFREALERMLGEGFKPPFSFAHDE